MNLLVISGYIISCEICKYIMYPFITTSLHISLARLYQMTISPLWLSPQYTHHHCFDTPVNSNIYKVMSKKTPKLNITMLVGCYLTLRDDYDIPIYPLVTKHGLRENPPLVRGFSTATLEYRRVTNINCYPLVMTNIAMV